jgi:hypothetical protein
MNKDSVAITKKKKRTNSNRFAQIFDGAALKLSEFFVDECDLHWRDLC